MIIVFLSISDISFNMGKQYNERSLENVMELATFPRLRFIFIGKTCEGTNSERIKLQPSDPARREGGNYSWLLSLTIQEYKSIGEPKIITGEQIMERYHTSS